jgi:rhodanese-related sulfurtransferase
VVSRSLLTLVARTALLLGVGAAVGFGVNALRAGGVHPDSFVAATSCEAPSASAVEIVAPAHAAHLCADGSALVADVRAPEDFARGHVAGAIHLPCAASGDVLSRALGAAEGKRTLLVYGQGTADAQAVAVSLRQKLPRPDLAIKVLSGGFPAWDAEGLACSSGPCPDCGVQARDRAAGAP